MTWAKIDDNMQNHPKVVAAGAIAELLQYRAIQYCCRYLTDGVLPAAAVPSLLTGLEHVGILTGGVRGMIEVGRGCPDIDWPAHMVAHGLWHRRKASYIVHDFLAYNREKSEVISERNARRSAGAKGAKVTNSKRWKAANAAATADPSVDGRLSPPALSEEASTPPTPPRGALGQSPHSTNGLTLTGEMFNACPDGQSGFCVKTEFLDRVPPDFRRQCQEHAG